ncbi:hypothetical protein BofuT4_P056190.1 [Botrytis cinerea T4]|uniref:Uncharacterized protein n=1 Tax=Botryotinia fuckeliana (strain T4) TaxID=999810 RepID=G2XW48_BOTF4|nr:hypothetical protein BofuT4_P056190.1 [Botrytis cinerea T4]
MKWFHIPEEKRQGPARSYYRGLCTVTTASIIVILFILISLVCQFPGKNNSILDIETPSITYKIYIYQYCVSSGHENDSGVDQNPNARDGLGCHLDLNPLGYIVATTNMQAEPSDLAAFYALMTAAFAFYYVGCHVVVLTIYLWWRWFMRHFDPQDKVPKKSFTNLMLACFKRVSPAAQSEAGKGRRHGIGFGYIDARFIFSRLGICGVDASPGAIWRGG